jgi:hypothetical protein
MPTSITIAPSPPPRSTWRRVRRTLFFALGVLALLAAGWSWLWHVAAGRTEDAIAAAIAREAKAGRNFSCASRVISGFPFALALDCDKPRLEIERASGKTVFTGQHLSGSTGLGALGHLALQAEGPVAIEAPGMSEAEAQWRSFTGDIALDLHGLDHADLGVAAPSLRMRNGQNMIASNAEALELHAQPDKARPEGDEALAVTGKLSRLVSPVLDALIGETSPADADFEASVSKAMAALRATGQESGGQESGPAALERWRAAGGTAHIARAALTKGPVKLVVTGDLMLDTAHRLSGRVDAAVEGADALAQRLPIPKIGLNLVKMSGGKLRVPAELADGRVTATLGPVAVPLPVVLLPLY